MEIKIQSIRFDATEKLEAFVEKKSRQVRKIFRRYSESRGTAQGHQASHGNEQGNKSYRGSARSHLICG